MAIGKLTVPDFTSGGYEEQWLEKSQERDAIIEQIEKAFDVAFTNGYFGSTDGNFNCSDSGGVIVCGAGIAMINGTLVARSASANALDLAGATISATTNYGKYLILQAYTHDVDFNTIDSRPSGLAKQRQLKHAFRVNVASTLQSPGTSLGTGKVLVGEILLGLVYDTSSIS